MSQQTFEKSLAELEKIVTQLEQGDVALEESLTAFKRGMELSKQCKDTLQHAEKTLAKIMSETNEELVFDEETK
ncbi:MULTISPECIES: exodeoxyribonuclease VII small subunit [Enterococcus]|uniref:Exodeoxyribonuclease 7 small subunit n=1 Tax=Enterococcus sulfureus ATCC 49903 TaxID=1140003 RepID=S0PEC6_9ENTE|nr:exodeoxyribonuclease VII small subunit [Enterococcus sulfureus]EOT51381.1 exodeoxyribonuclease VII, small subunit [Enterococcus sulfureus ATCC 49903]EOT87038.1 exodeoxyribonuclease VII, small subunit [Enterococcus sulfureus ATCC 49903]